MYDLKAEAPVLDVVFASGPLSIGSAASSIAILHARGLDLYDWDTGCCPRPPVPTLVRQVSFGPPKNNSPSSTSMDPIACATATPRQLCVLPGGHVYIISGLDNAIHMRLISPTGDATDVVREPMPPALGGLGGFALITDGAAAYCQQPSGNLLKLGDEVADSPLDSFPAFLPWFEVSSIAGSPVAFGLSRNGGLYVGKKLLTRNCTSFVVTPLHLIFSTGSHLVKFVHLDDGSGEFLPQYSIAVVICLLMLQKELEIPPDDANDERVRSIERGARLVAAMPTAMSLVLQMPRGNLETIYPRAMVLAGLRRLIEAGDYAAAFTHCHSQRVDLNILHDHRPAQFLTSIGAFIDQIGDVAKIDLFLSTLQ